MRRADMIAGLALAVLGLVTIFVVVPRQISGTSLYGIAPDVYPLTMIWLFTVLSAALLATRLASRAGDDDDPPLTLANATYIASVAGLCVAGYLAIAHLGFVAGGALIVATAMVAMGGHRRRLRLVLVSVLAPLAIYLVFRHLFVVILP